MMTKEQAKKKKEMSHEDVHNEEVSAENENNNLSNESSTCEPCLESQKDDSADLLAQKDAEIERLGKELETLKDLLQRRQADFENYKKRNARMQEEYKKIAIKDFALDVLNINDVLLRAIDIASSLSESNSNEVGGSLIEGVKLTSKRLMEAMGKYGIEEIESENMPFDPNFHEAVEITTDPDVEIDTVTKVYQKGFKLDEYVIRTAKVKVSKPMPKAETTEETNTEAVQ